MLIPHQLVVVDIFFFMGCCTYTPRQQGHLNTMCRSTLASTLNSQGCSSNCVVTRSVLCACAHHLPQPSSPTAQEPIHADNCNLSVHYRSQCRLVREQAHRPACWHGQATPAMMHRCHAHAQAATAKLSTCCLSICCMLHVHHGLRER
jgi:hypothetical protein